MGQRAVPAVVMRGGTSRGVFFHERDLPADKTAWDPIFVEAIGAPDRLQADGLGGTYSSTSKVMVVAPSERLGIDVEYHFGQVGLAEPEVYYDGNCGSLAAAVAAFGVEEGLVAATDPITHLRLFNRNTRVVIDAAVPVCSGHVEIDGDLTIPGVSRPGAPVVTSYPDVGGTITGALLPTGEVRELVGVPGLGAVEVSIVDASCVTVYVDSRVLGGPGLDPMTFNGDPRALELAEALRGACAVRLGLASDPATAARRSKQQPKLTLCGAVEGDVPDGPSLRVWTFSMQRMHTAFPVTGLLCTAVAATVPGTIPHALRRDRTQDLARLGTPSGPIDVEATVRPDDDGAQRVDVAISQSVRRIMQGEILVRAAP